MLHRLTRTSCGQQNCVSNGSALVHVRVNVYTCACMSVRVCTCVRKWAQVSAHMRMSCDVMLLLMARVGEIRAKIR